MFEKREFIKQFVREENGEKKYIVLDNWRKQFLLIEFLMIKIRQLF